MTQGSQAKPNTPGALPAGTKLGKYVIVAQLGVGGQSIVYKARDELLDRFVAIKQISAHVAGDEKFLTRFREVMRLLAKCSSEHVVAVLDLLEEPSGLYVVMEYVEGRTIEQMLSGRGGPIDVKTVLTILWRAAAGLAAIHRAGIVHRDIKPGNIMVGEGLRVKIMDFGVAARLGSAASMRLGTTKYMAPELFAGAGSDQRADIYSLGMIIYEMLAGRDKFNEVFHDIVRDSHSEALRWMKWHSSLDEPARPLTDLNAEVPPPLASIVLKMMAKDISHRYQDMETLGRDIRHNFAGHTAANGRHEGHHGHKPPHGDRPEGPASDAAEVTLLPMPEEPKTAEIPKKRMSLGAKLAVAGTLTALALAGLVTGSLVNYAKSKDQHEKAVAMFNAAENNYAEGAKANTAKEKRARFQQALDDYSQVTREFSQTVPTVAMQAAVKGFLANAQLDALNYNRDTNNLGKADEINRRLQRSGKEYAWTQQVEKQLEDFHAYRLGQLDFCQAVQDIRKAIVESRLDDAGRELKKAQVLALLREQSEELQAMQEDIQEKQKQKEYMALVQAGDEKAKLNNVDAALAQYDSAVKVIDEALGRHEISAKVYQDLKDAAEAKKAAVKNDAAYREAVAAGDKAELENNLLEAATAFDRAAAIRPTENKLTEKAKEDRYKYYFEQGQANLAAGQLLEAEAALKKAAEIKNSPEVRAALAQIDQNRGYQDLVRAGDKLLAAKDYTGALAKYNKAAELHPDPEIRGKVALATYNMSLDEGDKARDGRDWAAAEAAYAKADASLPGKPEVKARLDQVRNEQKYADLLAQAEQARQKGSFAEAVAKLKAAKEKIDKPEIAEKISQVRYEENMELGKKALADQNYTAAMAYFRQAKRFVSTPEVDKYIEQAQDGAGKQP